MSRQRMLEVDRYAYNHIVGAFNGRVGAEFDDSDLPGVARAARPVILKLRALGIPDDRLQVITIAAFRDVVEYANLTPEDFNDKE